jgi:hypothetical protein
VLVSCPVPVPVYAPRGRACAVFTERRPQR